MIENTKATETAQATSGLINPGFRYKINALVINSRRMRYCGSSPETSSSSEPGTTEPKASSPTWRETWK
ncbi:MAG: hypothetical protein ABIV11_04805 [Gemmatimonadaceae bacterium]